MLFVKFTDKDMTTLKHNYHYNEVSIRPFIRYIWHRM